jgi:ketosteroid isomerase-like protein
MRNATISMFGLLLLLTGCSAAPPPAAPDTREADANAIRQLEATTDWNSKDADKVAGSFYAANASLMFPNMPVITGMDAVKNSLRQLFMDPNFSLAVKTTSVAVSKASDYGYTTGTYELKMTDAKTKKPVVEKGKYVTVYEKQPDGSWKAVADINNADGPVTPAN